MTSRGHISTSISVGLIPFVGAYYIEGLWLLLPDLFWAIIPSAKIGLYFFGLVLGAIAPDIDEIKSSIGRKFRSISFIFAFAFGHRTITHWLIGRAVLIVLGLIYFEGYVQIFVCSFAIGMILHDLGDLATGGIKGYLWPFVSVNKNIRISNIQVASPIEALIIVQLNILIFAEIILIARKVYG